MTPTSPNGARASRLQSPASSTHRHPEKDHATLNSAAIKSRRRTKGRGKLPTTLSLSVNPTVVEEINRALNSQTSVPHGQPLPLDKPIFVPSPVLPRKRRYPMDVDGRSAHDSGPARKRRGSVLGHDLSPDSSPAQICETSSAYGSYPETPRQPARLPLENAAKATRGVVQVGSVLEHTMGRQSNGASQQDNDSNRASYQDNRHDTDEVVSHHHPVVLNSRCNTGNDAMSDKSDGPRNLCGKTASPSAWILWVIISVCLLSACLARLVFDSVFPLTVEYRAVDWTEKAIELRLTLASIPRIVLFGEESQSNTSQPGMLPLDGLSHDRDPVFGFDTQPPAPPCWFSNSTEFPRYVPWVTTSTGVFVPEHTFVKDLGVVMSALCLGIRSLERLPPFPYDDASCSSLQDTLIEFDSFHSWEDSRLPWYYTFAGLLNNVVTLLNLVHLLESYQNGTQSFGSDDTRVRGLYRPTSLPIDVPIAPSAALPTTEPLATRQVETVIPSGIPEDFINSWREAMEARSSQLTAEATSTPSIDTSTDRLVASEFDVSTPHKPADYTAAQANNGTIEYLLRSVINITTHDPLDLKVGNEMEGTTYGKIITYAEKLGDIHQRVLQLRSLISRILKIAPTVDNHLDQLKPGIQRQMGKFSLKDIEDIAVFFDQIAIPRLSEMLSRANRGVVVLTEAQKRQAELRNRVETTLRQGWVSHEPWWSRRRVYYYFPSLRDMAFQWSLARHWLLVEAEELTAIYVGREAEFKERHEEPNDLSSEDCEDWVAWHSKVVWSRWSLNDSRQDPDGSESFCLGDRYGRAGILLLEEAQAPIWERAVRWITTQVHGSAPRFQCGDASRRHGDGQGRA